MEVNSSISDAIPSVMAEKRCASAFPDSILIILLKFTRGANDGPSQFASRLYKQEKGLSGPFIPKGDDIGQTSLSILSRQRNRSLFIINRLSFVDPKVCKGDYVIDPWQKVSRLGFFQSIKLVDCYLQ